MFDSPPRPAFLPDFCEIRVLFVWLLTTQLLAVVLTLAAETHNFWLALALHSLHMQWIALMLAGVFCALRRPMARLSHAWVGAISWLLVLVATFLAYLGSHLLMPGLRFDWWQLARHLGIAAIISAMGLRYLYALFRQQERKLAEARARAQALQARIRPHFLFNSMNTIAGLTRLDARLAEQVVYDLSDLFRASLAEADQWSTLARELELAQGYLRIEAQRLGERLRVSWDVAALPPGALLPPLLLQPLLENAVYHGVEPALAGGDIKVVGSMSDQGMDILIENTLPPDRMGTSRQGNRMAQQNIRERIRAAFGEAGQMRLSEVDGYYRVHLLLPLREAPT